MAWHGLVSILVFVTFLTASLGYIFQIAFIKTHLLIVGNRQKYMFKLGIIINPLAGIGGPLALKGSDGAAIVAQAKCLGAELRAPGRAEQVLSALAPHQHRFQLFGYDGAMAADSAKKLGLVINVVGSAQSAETCSEDTYQAALKLKAQGVDLIAFVGGDGTARDIYRALGEGFPVLGIPSGVKMQSAVYAVSPAAAAEILVALIEGQLVDIGLAEVRDIDEDAYRRGRIVSRFYGELLVPQLGGFLQHVKNGGVEVEELVINDIAADIAEVIDDNTLYFIGAGTTTAGILTELGFSHSLLGIDAIMGGQLLGQDLDEKGIWGLLEQATGPIEIIIGVIGGQGHIIGRGNQQLSPRILRRVGLENIKIVAAKSKIIALAGRPLLVDSNDPELDLEFAGYRSIITGYHDAIIYPVGLSTLLQEKS